MATTYALPAAVEAELEALAGAATACVPVLTARDCASSNTEG
jgi:hypothetical protein